MATPMAEDEHQHQARAHAHVARSASPSASTASSPRPAPPAAASIATSSTSASSSPRGSKRAHADPEAAQADADEQDLLDWHPTPPKRRRRSSTSRANLCAVLVLALDEQQALGQRLQFATKVCALVDELTPGEAAEFAVKNASVLAKTVRALRCTAYVPLQQLWFTALAAMLDRMSEEDREAFFDTCRAELLDEDQIVLEILQVQDEQEQDYSDPMITRERVMQLNRSTHICTAFHITKCYISPRGKSELTRIKTHKWLDFGATTITLYWKDDTNTVIINIPYSCLESIETDSQHHVVYLYAKHLEGLQGVRLVAFVTTQEDFHGLAEEITSLIESADTTEQDEGGGHEIERVARSPMPASPFFRTPAKTPVRNRTSTSPSIEHEIRAIVSETADNVVQQAAAQFGALHERAQQHNAELTNVFSRINVHHLECGHQLVQQEQTIRAKQVELQHQRLVEIPQVEEDAEVELVSVIAYASDHHQDTLQYAAESLKPAESGFIVVTASAALLALVVVPWMLFIALYSGSRTEWLAMLRQALAFIEAKWTELGS